MQVEKKIYDLSEKEEKMLNGKRKVMGRLIRARFRNDMNNAARLAILDRVISDGLLVSSEKYDEKGLRVIMGDMFVHELGFRWVIVDDIHGRDFAIQHDGKSILIYPRLLISKLIRGSGRIDPFVLYHNMTQYLWSTIKGDSDPSKRSLLPMAQPLL